MAPRVLYTDGGSQGNGRVDQRARMAVFDAERGEIVVDQELGALTNNEAEYRAIEAALEYAAAHGLRSVEVRSDSQLCVSQIRGVWKVKEPRLQPAVQRSRARLAALGGTIVWVRREQNPAGHFLEGISDRPVAPTQPPGPPAREGVGRPPALPARPPEPPAVDEGQHCLRCGTRLVDRAADHRSRPTCPRCGWVYFADPKVAVAAALAVDGRILLCKRAIEPGLGKWSFPAGFVDRGEELRAALRREVLEETGLEAELGRLVGVYSAPGNPVVLVVYAARATGSPRASAEASELATFAPSELPELAFDHDRQIVADWLALNGRPASPASARRT